MQIAEHPTTIGVCLGYDAGREHSALEIVEAEAIAHLIEALLELECGVGAAELHRRLVTDVETTVTTARPDPPARPAEDSVKPGLAPRTPSTHHQSEETQ